MKRFLDAIGCLLLFAAILLCAGGVPVGIWEAVTRRSLAIGLLVLVFVALLVGVVFLALRLTGRTGGFWSSAEANKRRVGPPPEWHLPAPPSSGV
jgi:hypothetical protein